MLEQTEPEFRRYTRTGTHEWRGFIARFCSRRLVPRRGPSRGAAMMAKLKAFPRSALDREWRIGVGAPLWNITHVPNVYHVRKYSGLFSGKDTKFSSPLNYIDQILLPPSFLLYPVTVRFPLWSRRPPAFSLLSSLPTPPGTTRSSGACPHQT